MPLFEVYGSKVHEYRTIVSAADRSEAYDIAEARPLVDWNETETDWKKVIARSDIKLDKGKKKVLR